MRSPFFKCLVPGCTTSKEENEEARFFSLPLTEAILRQWALNIDRFDILEKSVSARKNYKICSIHFAETCFQTPEKKKFNRGAVPTLFLPGNFDNPEPTKKDLVLVMPTLPVTENMEPVPGNSCNVPSAPALVTIPSHRNDPLASVPVSKRRKER